MKTGSRGFTIVELLIVIVVIAILAAISIVAYNGIQQRARDSSRKSDLSNIAKSLQLYKIDNNGYPSSSTGCTSGSGGGGNGWLNHSNGTSSYPKAVSSCLIEGGYLTNNIKDPSGQNSCSGATNCYAYMVYSCPPSGAWLYANLESQPPSTTAADGTCAPSWDSSYGMNYVIKIE